jgi:lipoprotein-anchoring transpeptidase ErfK/SrfK
VPNSFSRRWLLSGGLSLMASSSIAFGRDREGSRIFRRQQEGLEGRDYLDPWDPSDYPDQYDEESNFDPDDQAFDDDQGFDNDQGYDPNLLPPPESEVDYPIERVDPSLIERRYWRQVVEFEDDVEPGTIVVDPKAHFLYFVRGRRQAIRYGVGVGRAGFSWSGVAEIKMKRRWPRWVPPKEMVARDERAMKWANGQPGGPDNPLGARALYLYSDGKDTLYRIHGTNEPESIGKSVSSGCIRMLNEDIVDLFERVEIGTKVLVRPS